MYREGKSDTKIFTDRGTQSCLFSDLPFAFSCFALGKVKYLNFLKIDRECEKTVSVPLCDPMD